MKKTLALTAGVAALILFSGCGAKVPETGAYPKQGTASGSEYGIFAKAPQTDLFTSKSTHLNETIAYALQVAAEQTLAKGYTYFAIQKPDEISNVAGVMTNTAKEYLDKCAVNNIAKSMIVLENPCKIATGGLAKPTGGTMEIKMYKTQDPSIITYNANEVLAGLKANGFYQIK